MKKKVNKFVIPKNNNNMFEKKQKEAELQHQKELEAVKKQASQTVET